MITGTYVVVHKNKDRKIKLYWIILTKMFVNITLLDGIISKLCYIKMQYA
jgi:hypothetical protein